MLRHILYPFSVDFWLVSHPTDGLERKRGQETHTARRTEDLREDLAAPDRWVQREGPEGLPAPRSVSRECSLKRAATARSGDFRTELTCGGGVRRGSA